MKMVRVCVTTDTMVRHAASRWCVQRDRVWMGRSACVIYMTLGQIVGSAVSIASMGSARNMWREYAHVMKGGMGPCATQMSRVEIMAFLMEEGVCVMKGGMGPNAMWSARLGVHMTTGPSAMGKAGANV